MVGVPIGHDDDLSPRARAVLAGVACIAAEDTRVTRALLRRLDIPAPTLVSYHDHNEVERVPALLARLQRGDDVALVSDAGTPLVSDPGYRLVTAAIDAGVPVVPVPGPCAAVAALCASGLPPDRFLVVGFLPREAGARRAALERLRGETATLLLYVAPHRALQVLADLAAVWGGDRRVALARSLTKPGEDWIRGTVTAAQERLEAEQATQEGVRGELTVVVEGAREPVHADGERVDALIEELVRAELPISRVRDIVAGVFDRPRRWVYQRALAVRAALDPEDP